MYCPNTVELVRQGERENAASWETKVCLQQFSKIATGLNKYGHAKNILIYALG